MLCSMYFLRNVDINLHIMCNCFRLEHLVPNKKRVHAVTHLLYVPYRKPFLVGNLANQITETYLVQFFGNSFSF